MKWRYSAVFIFFLFAFISVWSKLFYYQVVKAEELSTLGENQSAAHLEIPPIRGDIQASDGFPLVTNKMTYLVYANPKETKNQAEISQVIANILSVDPASLSAQLAQGDKVWVPLAYGISHDKRDQIDALHLPGVGFEEDPRRFYPEASMAAQLVGFVGKDTLGNDKGYFGLEGFYDMQLKGRIGQTTVIRDAFGKPVLAKLTENSGQQDGRTLNLHIDREIQYFAEKYLQQGVEQYEAKSGTVIVMDPKTGGILALANTPSFDPRKFWEYDGTLYRNPAVTDTYEPGSTMKPIIMASALDKGLITPTTTCPICGAPVKVGDYEIHTWNDSYQKDINMINIMIHSDNTGMVYISQRLKLDGILDTLNKFGFGSPTGIDLQGESALEIKPRDNWYPVDVATASFGQGVSVTPIQLIDAFASIANRGIRMEPHVVNSIETPDGQTIPILPKQLGRTMSEKTAKVMTEILVNTVNKGEANYARLKGYRIAGKTGTASIAKDGHYDQTKTIASFIGFAPADDPKFVMLVIMREPQVSIYGAETAAPTFFSIAQDILNHYNIAPTE